MRSFVERFLLVFVVIFLFGIFCKKETNNSSYSNENKIVNGKGFVMNESVCLYKNPQHTSSCERSIPPNTTVKVTQKNVNSYENDKFKIKFYKAEWNGESGYISYGDELVTRNFYTIVSLEKPISVKVNVSSLRFRKLPSLKAENIRPLLKGTKLEMIGIGAIKFEADGKYDAWAEVRTESGEIGYSFAGFLKDESKEIEERNGESGFVLLKSVPKLEKDLNTAIEKFSKNKELLNGSKASFKEEFRLFRYQKSFEKDGKKYYYIKKQEKFYGFDYVSEGELLEGWVDSAYIEVSGDNLYKYTRTNIKDDDMLKIWDYQNAKPDIKIIYNLKLTEKISILDNSGAYYVISYSNLDEDYNFIDSNSSVFLLRGDDIRIILNNFSNIQYKDLNNDGSYEWIIGNSDRSTATEYFYYNFKGKMINLIRMSMATEKNGCWLHVMEGADMIEKKYEFDGDVRVCGINFGDKNIIKIRYYKGSYEYRFDGTKLIKIK